MAEGFLRSFDPQLEVFSAGTSPAARVHPKAVAVMKELGIDTRRLRLVAICTVCTNPFLKEVRNANLLLDEIGLVKNEFAVTV